MSISFNLFLISSPRFLTNLKKVLQYSRTISRALFILGGLAALAFFMLGAAKASPDPAQKKLGLTYTPFVAARYQPLLASSSQPALVPETAPKAAADSFLMSYGAVLAKLTPLGLSAGSPLGGPDGIITYHVQPGDTLSGIAKKFNLSLNTILWANPKVSQKSLLKVGQELTILPVDGVIHEVKPGETLGGIALAYGVSLKKLAEFNHISEEGFIVDGQVLIVPGGTPPRPAPGRYAPATLSAASYFAKPVPGGRLTQGLHAFNAVDIAKACGAYIYAAAPGRVATADAVGWNGGYGKFIKIDHPNGTATLYAHLSQILVKQGQSVSRGAIIGRMGSTGRSTGCHVHFEVRGAANPFAY